MLVLDSNKDVLEFYRAKFPDVKTIDSGGFGLSRARNAGIVRALGDIVAFIDDDASADEFWLEELVKELNQPDIVGVGGLITPIWENSRPDWFPEELDWVVGCTYKGQLNEAKIIRNPIGCNMAFRREIFLKVGLFKEEVGRIGKKLLGKEETEFSIRVYNTIPNVRIVYAPKAVVRHMVSNKRSKFNYLMNRTYYEGVSKAILSREKMNIDSFQTENTYFKYILTNAIPRRLRRFYDLKSVKQVLVLLLAVCSVGVGYVRGKFVKEIRSTK
jgi:GT2 family glycosyltransferase